MIEVFPAASRFNANHGWLNSHFSFSFAEYYDPHNVQFGCLRVLNDDIVQPLKGFGAHPHSEMEIVSIVLKGHLEHQDSTGHRASTTFGGVQRMSAGTGIVHSEMNPSATEAVNFLQLWFLPDTAGLTPSYEQTNFEVEKLKNQLLPVVSKQQASEQIAFINQDLTIYLAELDEGKEISFAQEEGRKVFLFVIEGSLLVNGETLLDKRDSARITHTSTLTLAARTDSLFMLIDLV